MPPRVCKGTIQLYRPSHGSEKSTSLNYIDRASRQFVCHLPNSRDWQMVSNVSTEAKISLVSSMRVSTSEVDNIVICTSFDGLRFTCLSKVSPIYNNVHYGMEMREREHDEQNDSGFSSGPLSLNCSQPNSDRDLDILSGNVQGLTQSGCYFGPMDSASARRLLKSASVGTFLVRDSSDSNFLYSLSVKTERGATSVRIMYRNGLFQFDSDERVRHKLPQFDSVMALLDFHMLSSHDDKNKKWRWEDNSGRKMMKVVLSKPRKSEVSSLLHLSRVRMNQCLDNVHLPHVSVDRLQMLPQRLKDYLKEYPYRL